LACFQHLNFEKAGMKIEQIFIIPLPPASLSSASKHKGNIVSGELNRVG
jgi:hypothetical protein